MRDGVRGEVRAQVVRPSMPIPRIKIENLLACLRGNPDRKCKLKSAPYFISIQRRYFSGFESAFREEKRAIDKIPDGERILLARRLLDATRDVRMRHKRADDAYE
jgi:hypothetical protein